MKSFQIEGIPAVLYGETSQKLYLFVHGKHGQKEDAEQFAAAACQKGYQVLSLDLPEHGARKNEAGTFDPWHAVPELKRVISVARESWAHISLRANSIGAYFSMLGFANEAIERCLFVSPILDMERLIANLMQWSGVTEAQLEKQRCITTDFGETLSWEYLTYVRQNPIKKWDIPTCILYGSADNLTDSETVDAFVEKFGCQLTVMPGGEHWFHTPKQLDVLDKWTTAALSD
jgi:alpha-beta hydrolase superfamily lysophospholipase